MDAKNPIVVVPVLLVFRIGIWVLLDRDTLLSVVWAMGHRMCCMVIKRNRRIPFVAKHGNMRCI
jgi:hypothetical protein